MNKICSRCTKSKALSEFNLKKGELRQSYCKSCQAHHHRRHYLKNKKKYLLKSRASRKLLKEQLNEYKNKPCADCGIRYDPWIMDFDHLDGSKKTASISRIFNDRGLKNAIKEIAKCELVCSNCHRDRTYKRLLANNKT